MQNGYFIEDSRAAMIADLPSPGKVAVGYLIGMGW